MKSSSCSWSTLQFQGCVYSRAGRKLSTLSWTSSLHCISALCIWGHPCILPSIQQSPVLQGNRGAATRHYIQAGYAEGLSTDSFSPRQYLASNLDLLRVFAVNYTAATDHFIDTGYRENRNTDTFNEYRYIASNPADLISAFSNPDLGIIDGEEATDHYLRYGIGEGRSTTSFDPLAYMTANPDVALGVNNNPLEATKHYILFGYEEGRAIA
jgi:hypothetical protein